MNPRLTRRPWRTTKELALVAMPPSVPTWIGPVPAPGGTVAVIWLGESATKAAKVPPKETVVPVKFEPEITTEVPTLPFAGEKLAITGGSGVTMKVPANADPTLVAVVEWTATATHAKPISRGEVRLAPTGKVLTWNGVDVIPTRDGLVARKDVYADSMSFLRQLGATLP